MCSRRGPVRLLAACVLSLFTASPGEPATAGGDPYIVVLSDMATGDVARLAATLTGRHGGVVEHVYRDGIRAFAVRLPALSASGMRRDRLVASVESLAAPEPGAAARETAAPDPVSGKAPARMTAVERLPFAPGAAPKLRRVVTPAADRYRVVLADGVSDSDAPQVAERLVREHGGERGPVEGNAFRVSTTEAAAREMSQDARVAYVEEQSIAEPVDPARARHAQRHLAGHELRRVSQPARDRYRLVLRASVPDEQVEATVGELLRAYEGRRQPGRSDQPRVILVEMSEPSARALCGDFRVDYVEEQAVSRAAGTR